MNTIQKFIYQPPQAPLVVLYEDDDFIAIDKPAGLLSVMGRLPEHQDSAYLRILAQYPHARVTHRLDMATSGILLFAKGRQGEVAMSRIFQTRKIEKYYTAWVEGKIGVEGHVDVPLITDWDHRPRQKVDFEIGKSAQSHYKLLDYDDALAMSRIQLQPITGRSHQLRVHMQHIGHPIMGDKLYHPNPQRFHLLRMALHATQLCFQNPFHSEYINIQSDVPF